jgi:hypothetical protein
VPLQDGQVCSTGLTGLIFISIFQAAFEACLLALHYPQAHGGNFRVSERRIYRPQKETMSTKIDCVLYLKSMLANAHIRLASGPATDLPAAQRVQRLVMTAESISDGYFAIIEPLFEPITSKFMLTVRTLNESVISGASPVANFDDYIAALVTALRA